MWESFVLILPCRCIKWWPADDLLMIAGELLTMADDLLMLC
jgi:hypothetical protein